MEEEITTEELVEGNNFVLNALIDLLIEKKVFSEEEFKEKLSSMEKECEDCDCDNHESNKEESD